MKNLLITATFVFAFLLGSVFSFYGTINAAPGGGGLDEDKSPSQLACEGAGGTFDGGGCVDSGGDLALTGPDSLIGKVVAALLFITGVASVIMVIVGGIRYVVSAGDQNNVTAAKNTILYAVIGLVISALAYALVRFVAGAIAG